MRPNKAAVLSALAEFDEIGRKAFMEKYGFSDRNITYEVEHDGRSYPSKAIFGSAFGYMPEGIPRNSETCNGTEAREHLEHLGFDILSKDAAESSGRPFVLFNASGQAFQPTKTFNRTTGNSAYRLQRRGTSNKTDDAEEVDAIIDVARAMLLEGRLARVKATNGTGPANYVGYGKRTLVRYELDPSIAAALGIPARSGVQEVIELDRSTLDRLRQLFITKHPEFQTFENSGSYLEAEDTYKRVLIDRASDIMREQPQSNEALGAALLDLVAGKGGAASNLLDWRIAKLVADIRQEEPGKIEEAAGKLARGEDAIDSIAAFTSETWPMLLSRTPARPFAESRTIPTMIRGLIDAQRVLGIRSTPTDNAAKMLLGKWAFGQQPLSADELRGVISLAEEIARVMHEDWDWRPRDLWDVQGFIWETCQKRLSNEASQAADPATGNNTTMPTNLILYGPPGTGKTFATAAEAVKLCGETVPSEREALMTAYRRLADAGRIEFVTFHQSVAYEDFVEGLRPTQGTDGGSAGFELKPEPGVFRRIARRAETSTGPGNAVFSIAGRKVFKMSIGEASNPDDAYLFEEAIDGGYTLLGFEDIDWSDARFADRDAIIAAVRTEGVRDGEPNAMSGRVQMPFIFRNWVKPGDVIIVSKGNGLFRAIGEVTGDYQFEPREGGGYAHRRAVRWLWVDRAGVPSSEIYARSFTQKSIYVLTEADLNVPALERYISSQQGTGTGSPEPFVLVIDEINRANISKVFGELITLLEADKRIGQPNALKVRLPYSGDIFGVPANLHIIGTMNTADRSIALLDTALRRRFEFRELMPDPALLRVVDDIDVAGLLATINERIEYLFDREHQIGHAYFIRCVTRADVDEVMRHKVIPLLAEYFYEDWAKVAAVLGDGDDGEGDREGSFIDRRRLKAPKGLGGDEDAAPRYRWSVRDTFSYAGFAAA